MKTPEQQLEDLIAAREKASKGPWRYSDHDDPGDGEERIWTYWVSSSEGHLLDNIHDYQTLNPEHNLKFMVQAANFAATAAPELLAKLKKYEEALRYWKEGFESLGPSSLQLWQANGIKKTN